MIINITNSLNKMDLLNNVIPHTVEMDDIVTAIMVVDQESIACGHLSKDYKMTIYFKMDEETHRLRNLLEHFLLDTADEITRTSLDQKHETL